MKAVLPAAGLGTRLLPATKEQPKEMLSLFTEGKDEKMCVKPLLQMVYEQLYDAGFREFCFIVGRGKRTIEDHFTPDQSYVELMHEKGKERLGKELSSFYEKIKDSTIVWINQPEARGFGDAVLKAKSFVDDDNLLVHAGDTYITSNGKNHLERVRTTHQKYDSEATLTLQEIDNPKKYGVVEAEETGKNEYKVENAVEKPEEPPSNLAIMPVYVFEPSIFDALEETSPGVGDEIQLTDGFMKLSEWGNDIRAIELEEEEVRWDIGTSETYWEALQGSYEYTQRKISE